MRKQLSRLNQPLQWLVILLVAGTAILMLFYIESFTLTGEAHDRKMHSELLSRLLA
jgi:hypothetical protein